MTKDKKTNGALFENNRKSEEWQSDYSGSIEIIDTISPGKYFLNGYKSTSKNGNKYTFITIGKKMDPDKMLNNTGLNKQPTVIQDKNIDIDDDILF